LYSVSSDFQVSAAAKNAAWTRQLLIGDSDYTDAVLKWPTISKKWDGVNPQTVVIDLANEGQLFNFLMTDPTKMHSTVSLKMGFTYVGSEELLTMFSGTIDSARYSGGSCKLTLIDKFRKLADRKVGDTTSPVSYTASSYLVHDMGWYACTSLGGLSAITSTNNPDIDYQSWSSWSSVFSVDNVRVKAQLTGQTPLEMLRKLSMLTQSAIYVENDKIKFGRFTIAGSGWITLDNSKVVDAEATLDDRQLVNKQYVSAAYDTTSKSFGITVQDVSTYSVNSYGIRENLIAESFVWLTDSVSALNLAQRIITSNKDIQSRYSIKAPIHSVLSTIGDAVLFQDTMLDVSDTYRIMEETLNMDSGLKTFSVDQTQYFGAFILDVSALDSSDVLT
jgi:hypothetical protein